MTRSGFFPMPFPRPWTAAALVACLLAVPGWAQETAGRPDGDARIREARAVQLVNQAEERLRQKKPEEAAALFRQAAELAATDAELWDRAGWAHLDVGQAEPALTAFQAEQKLLPPRSAPPGGLVISHFALGNAKEVQALIRQLLPEEPAAAASEVVTKGLAAKERTPDWNYALGYLYARVLGKGPRGLPAMEAVVQAQPNRAEAWLLLVEMNREINRGPQEDAAAVRYLELAPEAVDAYRLRAERYAAIQRYADAVAEYETGIKKHPGASTLYFQLARLHESLGAAKPAEDTYRSLIAHAKSSKQEALRAQASLQLANFFARARKYAEAEKLYAEAVKRPDTPSSVLTNWGSLLALTGQWEPAARALARAAEREEKAPESAAVSGRDDLLTQRYRAAVAHLAAGKKDEARRLLETAYAAKGELRSAAEREVAALLTYLGSPTAPKLDYQRGDERWAGFVWRREQLDEGEYEVRGRFSIGATGWRAILQQAQQRYADAWPADYALARIYASGGNTTAALDLLRRASQRKADWWALWYPLGQYYAQRRDKELGIPALERVVRLAPESRQARSYLFLLRGARDPEPEPPRMPEPNGPPDDEP